MILNYMIRIYDRQGQFTSISFEAAQYQAAPNMFVVLDKVQIPLRG